MSSSGSGASGSGPARSSGGIAGSTTSPTSAAGTAITGSASAASAGAPRRNRIRLSCTTCREKKLKCNRATPCDQCEKRGLQSNCIYVPYLYPRGPLRLPGPAGRTHRPFGPSDVPLQDQVRQLRELVHVLRAELARRGGLGPTADGDGPDDKRGGPDTPGDLSGVTEPTPAGTLTNDQRYVDNANWEAISDDLRTDDGDDDGDEFDSQQGPALVVGTFPPATISELMMYLPPKGITDRLISRFFQGKEPAWLIFHIPTFFKQYRAFWDNPSAYSVSWVGLLCVMIAHAANFCLRGDEEVPGAIGSAQYVSDLYRVRSAYCIAMDDYTKPGKYKVEALLLYFGTEYLRVRDAQRGTSILLSITVRLAMHMGLHRDPEHYKEISTFEGQMRRRLWTVLAEIDCLVSYQFGLPANIQSQYFDTKLPANLCDEDFDENTETLPAQRPLTERTPALYTIVKSRIVVAMADIVACMQSHSSPTYGEVMRLDRQLEEAHDAIPPVLRARTFSLSIQDPIDLIMQRLWIELMYQKARIVLHRRYFMMGRTDVRYRASTQVCMDAATTTLEHQLEVHTEIQIGGRLSKEQWFLSSLSTHDFLLADMIICLEISCVLHNSDDPAGTKENLNQLLEIIRVSRHIWSLMRRESQEAGRAFKILSRMISVATGMHYDSSPEAQANLDNVDLRTPPSYHFTGAPSSPYHPGQAHAAAAAAMPWPTHGMVPQLPGTATWMPAVAVGEGHMDSVVPQGAGVDWSSWDTQIQNASAEMLEIPWTNFFGRAGGAIS